MGNRLGLEYDSQEMVQHPQSRNLTPLVFPEDDSQYTPRTTPVPCLQSSCHLLPETFNLAENVFSFKYDTLNPCKMKITPKGTHSDFIDIGKTSDLAKGMGQEFVGWELNLGQSRIKKLEIEIESKVPVLHIEVTTVAFDKNGDIFAPCVEKQIIRYKGKEFVIKDLFGLPQAEERSECSVCLFNPKDTLILPCYHICLCASCANMLRVQTNKKCPLCRSGNFYIEAEGLLKLNFEDSAI